MADESPNKRKRPLDDEGDRGQKKVQREGDRLAIQDLHLDVGAKYLLCQTRKTPLSCSHLAPRARSGVQAARSIACQYGILCVLT